MKTYMTVTGTVQAGSVPAWYANLAANTWGAIADGTGEATTIAQVAPAISAFEPKHPSVSGPTWGNEGPSGVINDWTGACVNPAFKELLIPAAGGHDGYYGNEIYSLRLDQDAPKWRRLNSPTPSPNRISGFPPSWPATYPDGRPPSLHQANQVQFAASTGRIFLTAQTAISGDAASGAGIMSILRSGLPQSVNDAPQAYAANAGGWVSHDDGWDGVYASDDINFRPSVVDPNTGIMWQFANNNYVYSITPAGVKTRHPFTMPSGWNGTVGSIWAVGTANGYAIIGQGGVPATPQRSPRVFRFDFDQVPTTKTAVPLDTTGGDVINFGTYVTSGGTTTGGVGRLPLAAGAVYHPNSNSIYVGDPNLTGIDARSVFKLNCSTWVWSVIVPGGAISSQSGTAGIFSKWNIVDMGGGNAALVCASRYDGPTYVLKIPPTGLS